MSRINHETLKYPPGFGLCGTPGRAVRANPNGAVLNAKVMS
jgi:hypothetical protein